MGSASGAERSYAAVAAKPAASVAAAQVQRSEAGGGIGVGNLTIARQAGGGAAFPGAAIGNQQQQRAVRVQARVQAKCATCEDEARRNGVGAKCRTCAGESVQVSEPGDPLEREADAIASTVTGARPTPARAGVQRKASDGGAPRAATADVAHPEALPGHPLDGATRADMEGQLGADFGDVRVHTGPPAGRAARSIDARAFTHGSHVVFDDGEFQPGDAGGKHLLAHELVHVIQQRGGAAGAARVQREGNGDPPPSGPPAAGPPAAAPPSAEQHAADESAHQTDSAATSGGPCAVEQQGLSNQGLLVQLNRARLYLTQHTWGEDETYDYNNLLVRLSAERRRRIYAGHVWLAEPGLIAPPGELYSLAPGNAFGLTVSTVAGGTAAGGFVALTNTLLTRGQFTSFLTQRNLPTIEMQRILDDVFGGSTAGTPRSTDVTLPPVMRTVAAPSPLATNDLLGPLAGPGAGTDPGSIFGMPAPAPADPFGAFGGGGGPGANPLPSQFYLPFGPATMQAALGAQGQLQEARELPGTISSSGPERVFTRAEAPPQLAQMIAVDAMGNQTVLGIVDMNRLGGVGPTGLSSLGALTRPSPLGPSESGFMWEGSHATQVAPLAGRMLARGFRAPFDMHAQSTIFGRNSQATADLNVGTPGALMNDSLFPAFGEAWGRGPMAPGHWNQGSVAIVRADGTPVQSAELAQLMLDSIAPLEGQQYRFSPPGAGSRPFERADQRARERGRRASASQESGPDADLANGFDPSRGAQMCINPPCVPLNERAIGQPLRFTRADGTVVDLSRPDQATARAMSEFMSQPAEFWAARGLRRVPIGGRVLGGYGVSAGLGIGLSLLSDANRARQGEDPAWMRDAAFSGGGNVIGAAAEDWAFNAATPRIASALPGLGAEGAGIAGRFAAGTGVAIILAPLITAGQMALDGQQYTNIDYASRMGRSAVAATGGALATIGTATAIGSGAGPVGTVVGFVVGVGVYIITDALLGDATETAIRDALGESGCTGGTGHRH